MQAIKGKTSHHLLQDYRRLRATFWGRHLWGRGYFVASSGNVTDETIADYIRLQGAEPQDDDRPTKLGPLMFQCACLACNWRSMASTRRSFNISITDWRVLVERSLLVSNIALPPPPVVTPLVFEIEDRQSR